MIGKKRMKTTILQKGGSGDRDKKSFPEGLGWRTTEKG